MSDNIATPNASDINIDASTAKESRKFLIQQLEKYQQQYQSLPKDASPTLRGTLLLEMADALLGLNQYDDAWKQGRQAFDIFFDLKDWQHAVEACNILYQTSRPASIVALGHGVWLGITFPIAPETTVAMLQYIIDETPPDADGAAVAAITAHYIADQRSEGEAHNSLTFLTQNILANVAKDHSKVKSQEELNAWIERLELNNPDIFLPRLATVINVMVKKDEWWFDRDLIRNNLPE